jgi:hypothetical protein
LSRRGGRKGAGATSAYSRQRISRWRRLRIEDAQPLHRGWF